MELFIYRIIEMSIISSFIGFVILGIKRVNSTISVRLLNLLWIVFAIFLIIPFHFGFSINIPILKNNPQYVLDYSELMELSIENIKDEEQVYHLNNDVSIKRNSGSKVNTLFAVWMCVGGSLLLKDVIIYLVFCFKVKKKIISLKFLKVENTFEKIKSKLNYSKKIDLIMQEQVNYPAILGYIKPRILISKEFLDLSSKEQEDVFTHELLHLKKYDNLKYLFFNVMKRFYWFNPIISYMINNIKEDIELSTDSMTVKYTEDKKSYLMLILKISQLGTANFSLLPAFSADSKNLERRIKTMNNENKINSKVIAIFCALLTIVVACGVCFASVRFSEDESIVIEKHDEKSLLETTEKDNIVLKEDEYVFPLDNEDAKIANTYGERVHVITGARIFHDGLDLTYDACTGDSVYAIADGVVEKAEYDGAKGNVVIIKHQNSTSEYRHLSSINVNVGDVVKAGDEIGNIGSTGLSTGPHLHLSIQDENGEYVDPINYIK